ncbi:MAG: N-acetylmuramic acid 6-phosphate etherase, partial [Bacteroidales bacterium]|nr:N-acetylmuramic acid 6-phosphate etherase [Bacteroidales bacterium]
MSLNRVTEQSSNYAHLDKMTTEELLMGMNKEDQSVPVAVGKCIPQITKFVDGLVERMKKGGRLFYLGAGTSGRLGILDASEIPPTYGAPYDLVIGLIAGGDTAIRKAVENAEDDYDMGWKDLEKFNIGGYDSVVGIAASGST